MASALLLVDVQRNMLEAPSPVPDATAVAAAISDLLDRARRAGATVVHVRNNGDAGVGDPDAPGSPGWELVHHPFPEEIVADKFSSDSFEGTGIAERLPAGAVVVVAGMQSEYCVRATSVSALARGYRVVLASGAHATYPDDGSAAEISARIERELAAAGVDVLPHDGIRF